MVSGLFFKMERCLYVNNILLKSAEPFSHFHGTNIQTNIQAGNLNSENTIYSFDIMKCNSFGDPEVRNSQLVNSISNPTWIGSIKYNNTNNIKTQKKVDC